MPQFQPNPNEGLFNTLFGRFDEFERQQAAARAAALRGQPMPQQQPMVTPESVAALQQQQAQQLAPELTNAPPPQQGPQTGPGASRLPRALAQAQQQPQAPQQPPPQPMPQQPMAPQSTGAMPQSPPMDDYSARDAALAAQHQAATQALEQSMAPPDASQLEQHQQRRASAGNQSLLMALAARQAGEGFSPLAQHFMKQSADASQDMKMTGGTLTAEGWVPDPGHAAALKVKSAEARVASIERAQAANVSASERRRLEQDKIQATKELRDATLGMQGFIASQASADRRYGIDVAHGDRVAALGAKGGGRAAEAAAEAAVNGRDTLDLLTQAEKHLPNATSSYIGYGADQAARVVGKSTQGSQATAALQTIAGQLVAKMPKMSGPQSDKDVQLYREMAGKLDDPTMPYADRAAAVAQIRALNQKYAPGGAPAGGGGGGAQQSLDDLLKKY